MLSSSTGSDANIIDTGVKKPIEYFQQYLNEDFFSNMAEKTNMKHVSLHGKSLGTTTDEIKKYWAASIVISLLGFPKLRMCWEQRTRYPLVADNISRDRFYSLRSSLKVVDDDAVSDNEKSTDRYWKVRPLLSMIRKACLQHPRPDIVCIDEQMVPFHGQVRMKQYVRGKPQPVGLKNFVMATSSGLPLDFYMYEGGQRPISSEMMPMPEKLDIGGKVVLKLSDTLPVHGPILHFFASSEFSPHSQVNTRMWNNNDFTITKRCLPEKGWTTQT